MVSTPVYDSLVYSISQYKQMNEIQNQWNKHVTLLNTTYPGYDNIDPTPKDGDGHMQNWQSSNGQNYLSNFKNTEISLINYTFKSVGKYYVHCQGYLPSAPGSKAYLIENGLIHPTAEDMIIASKSMYSLPMLTPELCSHPYVIERHNRFGYPISEILKNKQDAEQKQKDQEEKVKKEAEDARIWAANRLPGEKPLANNIVTEYRLHNKKMNKISTIIKEHPSYTHIEIESILHYLTSQKETNRTNKYEKNLTIAMKALNRFAKENDIDVNSAIIIWNDYL